MESVRQRFKGEVLTRTVVKNRILGIYEQANEQELINWYEEAFIWGINAMKDSGIPVLSGEMNKFFGVVAALSPRKYWRQNKAIAIKFITDGADSVPHTDMFIKKAKRIWGLSRWDASDAAVMDILKGDKITAFYYNLRHYNKTGFITIDRHMLSICTGYWLVNENWRKGVTKAQYEFFSQCVRLAADHVKIPPQHLQGVVWEVFRRVKHNFLKM